MFQLRYLSPERHPNFCSYTTVAVVYFGGVSANASPRRALGGKNEKKQPQNIMMLIKLSSHVISALDGVQPNIVSK